MFKVIVLACSIGSTELCYEYHDTRGPYISREQCHARAYEMGNDIRMINKGALEPVKFRCVTLNGTQL